MRDQLLLHPCTPENWTWFHFPLWARTSDWSSPETRLEFGCRRNWTHTWDVSKDCWEDNFACIEIFFAWTYASSIAEVDAEMYKVVDNLHAAVSISHSYIVPSFCKFSSEAQDPPAVEDSDPDDFLLPRLSSWRPLLVLRHSWLCSNCVTTTTLGR